MNREELITALSEVLDQKVGRIATRYICFNPYTMTFRTVSTSTLVKNLEEVSCFKGLTRLEELDYGRIVDYIVEQSRTKHGIEIIKKLMEIK